MRTAVSRARRAAIFAIGIAVAVPAAARADQIVTTTASPTAIASGQGLLAFSSYDASIDAYRLMISRSGRVEPAAVPPSPAPFDVDVGPTSSGRPYVVYSRCQERATPVPSGCDVYAYDPASGRENRYDASSPTESEVHATYWKGRVAFVRYDGSGDDARPVVYTRRARSSRPSERLPGVPDRRCLERRGCGPVTGTIDELELYGEHLAQTASTFTDAGLGRRMTELRLVDVETERSAQIGARGTGESGQQFIGPSFVAGRLHTYFTCRGDGGGCIHGIGGAYRYRYSTGDWAKAPTTEQLAGFDVSALGTFVQPLGPGGCAPAGAASSLCRIVERVPSPDYRPTARAPRTG
jgi:hypothetical protein